ncbi:transcriptional regulator, LacI family [Psychromonas ingrahamii 37]|uniref:Transcriptional regulator, LacI family n=1 Tax=Psychromonas ingrahamii (strain DSM 17664 / CCUG 51855 / 37) TaxID=357804 RepID=A1SWE6_PSYIN|nr:LacI family DNA-binding transcriptional regulator [Psychromonas ingrahamii]ABM03811.1 transcriptional regulator, LacI family [Psychromonas ingrahamii 37]
MEVTRKRRGTGRVTLADVAKAAGVGTMTVSRVLRMPDQVSDKLRDKIQQVIDELGYIPNRAAGALASGKSNSIAVILPSLVDKMCSQFIPPFQNILNQAGHQLILGYSNYSISQEEQLLSPLLASNPSAIVLFGSERSAQSTKMIKNAQLTMLEVAEINDLSFDLNIGIDHYQASKEMTNYLIKKGYQNIAFVGFQNGQNILRKQLGGWQSAMLENYLSPDHFLIANDLTDIKLGSEGLAKLLLRESTLDAVICTNEEIATGVLFECQRRVLKIPQDIAITCLDGSILSQQCVPTLTSIELDYVNMGKEAANLLLERLLDKEQSDAKQINIGFKLCERASS